MGSRFLLTNDGTSVMERGWGFVVVFGKGQEYGSVKCTKSLINLVLAKMCSKGRKRC